MITGTSYITRCSGYRYQVAGTTRQLIQVLPGGSLLCILVFQFDNFRLLPPGTWYQVPFAHLHTSSSLTAFVPGIYYQVPGVPGNGSNYRTS